MKSKKGVIEMSVGTIVTIVLLMTVLVLGLVLTRITFTKQQYKITQEVCENVTITPPGSASFTFDARMLLVEYMGDCMFYGTQRIQNLKIDYMWNDCKTKHKDVNCTSMKAEIDKLEIEEKNAGLKCAEASKEYKLKISELENSIKPYNKTICETQEVDEMKVNVTNTEETEVCNCGYVRCYKEGGCGGMWARDEMGFGRETPVNECYENLDKVRNDGTEIISFNGLCNNNHIAIVNITKEVIISKKDITERILDENCECLNYYNYFSNANTLIESKKEYEEMYNFYCNDCYNCVHTCKEMKSVKCSQYKCPGNFTVEVKQ